MPMDVIRSGFAVSFRQARHSLSDERTEYLIKDRLSFMRFLGLTLADRVPDANSIWNFRELLTRTIVDGKPAIEVLFKRFDAALAQAGFLAMGGQIIDATIVAAPSRSGTRRTTAGVGRRIAPCWKPRCDLTHNPKPFLQDFSVQPLVLDCHAP